LIVKTQFFVVLKVDYFILGAKIESVAQIEWKKHPYIFFLLLVQKYLNEFKRKKSEKILKPKRCRQLVIQIFSMKNQNNQL
jgi:hypothetical protein